LSRRFQNLELARSALLRVARLKLCGFKPAVKVFGE